MGGRTRCGVMEAVLPLLMALVLGMMGFSSAVHAACWDLFGSGVSADPTFSVSGGNGSAVRISEGICEATLVEGDIIRMSFVTTQETTSLPSFFGGGAFDIVRQAPTGLTTIHTYDLSLKPDRSFADTRITIAIVNPNGFNPGSFKYTLDIKPGNVKPTISSTPATVAPENTLYAYDVDATDPDVGDVLTYSLDVLPSGMTIDIVSGLILWTPSSARIGLHDVAVRVTDMSGLVDTQSFVVSVIMAPMLPDSSANFDASGTDGDPVNTFTGELFNEFDADLNLGGPMSLLFSRYYASGLSSARISGSLGANWRHTFEWTLTNNGTAIDIVNDRGRLIQFTQNGFAWDLAGKTDIVYQLDEDAGVFTLLDPRSELLYTFNASGRLTDIGDGKGNVHTLTYDGGGLLVSVTDGLGRTLSFTYDMVGGLLASVGDGARKVSFTRTGNDLIQVIDALGGMTDYVYVAGGLMTSSILPAGNTRFSQTWNGTGQVATQTDADGNTFSFDYSALDTTITDPLGDTRVHSHTATGEFSNRTDQMGESFAMGSDATGRRNSITDRLGGTTTLEFDAASGNISSVTNPDGTTSGRSYTARPLGALTFHDLTMITHADGTTESIGYDAMGNAVSHTDQLGNTATGVFDANGQPLTTTNVAGGTTTKVYNSDATLFTTTDPAGNTTTLGYDLLKRVNLITAADGSMETFTYDDSDHLIANVDPNGNMTTIDYDGNGNPVTATDPLGNTTTFGYDGNDRVLSTTDPLGNSASRTYTPLGKVATLTDENSNTTSFGYDILGRHISTTDPLGFVSSQTYDAEAILTSSTDPQGNTTTLVSDSMGRITDTTSPLGNVSSVTYDALGRLASRIDPLGNMTTFSRDLRGLLSGVTLPGGAISATYTRNALGSITGVTDPKGNLWPRVYDASGRLTSSSDPLGNTNSVAYDNRNRLSEVTYPGALGTVTLGYDPAGNRGSTTYSDGTTLKSSFDANDRLIATNGITRSYDANGRITETNGIVLTRDAGGRITTVTLAPGKSVTYAYDANDRLTQVTDWAGGITTFSYDNAGRRTAITRPNGVNTTTTWDADSRLTGITEGAISTIALTRDAKGQITAAVRSVPLAATSEMLTNGTHTFDAASQVSEFTYDGLGRLTSDGARTFAWDLASRLTSITEGGTTTTFTYDALGNRLSRTVGGVTSAYVWNYAFGLPSVSIETLDGADLRYFIHTPGGELLYAIDATTNARSFYHFDEMGNTLFVTADDGAVIATYAYSPYGRLIDSTGSFDNPFTWQGRLGMMDEGNGVYYARARYYDSATGRFISRDPIKSIGPKSINPYQYAFENPLRFVDPSGDAPTKEEVALAKAEADFTVANAALNRSIDRADLKAITISFMLPKLRRAAREAFAAKEKPVVDAFKAAVVALDAARAARDAAIARARSANVAAFFSDAIRTAASKREANILHMKDILLKAIEKVSNAKNALNTGGTRTRAEQDARRKGLDAANTALGAATEAFERAGGNVLLDIELVPIVTLN